MIDHVLPLYAACNYRTLRFIFVRTPRIKDFPRERNYRRESLDLLYRHFYKGKQARRRRRGATPLGA